MRLIETEPMQVIDTGDYPPLFFCVSGRCKILRLDHPDEDMADAVSRARVIRLKDKQDRRRGCKKSDS